MEYQDTRTQAAQGSSEAGEMSLEEREELISKYDSESVSSGGTGLSHTIVKWIAIAMSVFHITAALSGRIPTLQYRSIHLAFVLALGFLCYPGFKKNKGVIKPLDWLLAALGAVSAAYVAAEYSHIIFRASMPTTLDIVMFCVMTVVLFLATRRSVGWALVIIPTVFLIYAFFGRQMPGILMHKGITLTRMTSHMFLGTEGIFGVSLGTCATYIIVFVIFSAFLERSGLGEVINDIAFALAGWTAGGPGKISVITSAAFGTISGSAVANVVTTGAFTIPLMKKTGFESSFAGGVEAVSSTGGQLMPPVMGAAAFIMADMMGVSYTKVCLAALFPVLLYYFNLFICIHLHAKKLGLHGMSKENLPKVLPILKARGHLLLPFLAVIVLLTMGYTPLYVGAIGIMLVIVSAALRKSTRMNFKDILWALEKGAKNSLSVSISCAAVGLIVGVFTLTGLSAVFSNFILKVGDGQIYLTLFFVMILAIVLGMGLPTVAVYLLMTTVAIPILIAFGIEKMPAHFFVFYFGLLAGLTPPVAVTAYAAAGLAEANPTQTALHSLKLALAGFLIPYVFVLAPEMLFASGTVTDSLYVFAVTLMGIVLLGASVEGYLLRPLPQWQRLLSALTALMLIYPEKITDLIGLIIFCLLFILQKWGPGAKKEQRAAAVETKSDSKGEDDSI